MVYNDYADLFKCLSHRSRIRLLDLLATRGEMSVSEISLAFEGGELEDRDSSTISRNLNILKRQGLVSSRRQAQTKFYSMNLGQLQAAFASFANFLKDKNEAKLVAVPNRFIH